MLNFERELSPERLVSSQAAKESSEQQQRDIYESHRHRTFSLAFYMTGNEIEAEQILTDTFIQAFQQTEKPDGFAIDTALVGELDQRFPLRQQEPAPVVTAGTGLGQRNVLRPELEAAIRALPPSERFLFLLRDVEGYKADKIGQLLNLPEAQVQRTCMAARIRLCKILADQARHEAA